MIETPFIEKDFLYGFDPHTGGQIKICEITKFMDWLETQYDLSEYEERMLCEGDAREYYYSICINWDRVFDDFINDETISEYFLTHQTVEA